MKARRQHVTNYPYKITLFSPFLTRRHHTTRDDVGSYLLIISTTSLIVVMVQQELCQLSLCVCVYYNMDVIDTLSGQQTPGHTQHQDPHYPLEVILFLSIVVRIQDMGGGGEDSTTCAPVCPWHAGMGGHHHVSRRHMTRCAEMGTQWTLSRDLMCWDGGTPSCHLVCWDGGTPSCHLMCWDGGTPSCHLMCWDGGTLSRDLMCWDGGTPSCHLMCWDGGTLSRDLMCCDGGTPSCDLMC